jgi:RNA polymerase sigma-70 factor (ECF subfamily)
MMDLKNIKTDIDAISSCLSGNPNAFSFLVDKYEQWVYAIAHGYAKERAATEDIVQKTFIKVYTGLKTLQNPETFKSWITQITKTTALNHIRDKKTFIPLHTAVSKSHQETPGLAVEEQETNEQLYAALEKLPEKYRSPIWLYYIGGESYEQIGQVLDIKQTTVKSRIHDGKMLLRRIMGKLAAKGS